MGLIEKYHILKEIYRNRFSGKPRFEKRSVSATQLQWITELQTHGVCRIPDFLSPQECDRIASVIDQKINQVQANLAEFEKIPRSKFGRRFPDGYGIWNDHDYADFRIFNAEVIDEGINAFFSNQSILDTGSNYLKADLEVRFTMANRVTWQEGNKGSGGGWHRDMTYKRGFKAMVYLSDVDQDSGPFQYIPLSGDIYWHLKKARQVGKYQFTHDEIMDLVENDESKIVTATAKKGTLLLFETNLIHRGKPINEGKTRFAMTNYHNF